MNKTKLLTAPLGKIADDAAEAMEEIRLYYQELPGYETLTIEAFRAAESLRDNAEKLELLLTRDYQGMAKLINLEESARREVDK